MYNNRQVVFLKVKVYFNVLYFHKILGYIPRTVPLGNIGSESPDEYKYFIFYVINIT